jgi:hypothetical protein
MTRRADLDYVDPRFGPELNPTIVYRIDAADWPAARNARSRPRAVPTAVDGRALGVVDRADLGRRRLDRGARRRDQPARLVDPVRRDGVDVGGGAGRHAMLRDQRRQRLLRRDPAFALARPGGRRQRLGRARSAAGTRRSRPARRRPRRRARRRCAGRPFPATAWRRSARAGRSPRPRAGQRGISRAAPRRPRSARGSARGRKMRIAAGLGSRTRLSQRPRNRGAI